MVVDDVPSFCSHEHWGSINALMGGADARCGAVPERPAGLADLLLDPYFGTFLRDGGWNWEGAAAKAGFSDAWTWAKKEPEAFFTALRPALRRHRLTGAYQTLRTGLLRLYDVSLEDCTPTSWQVLDRKVAHNYARIFDWYDEARGANHLTECIRPVNPEFFYSYGNKKAESQEKRFMTPVMRVDPLLRFWTRGNESRERLSQLTGIDPVDAESWRAFIAALFAAAEANGAVGSKQYQGYMRVMHFPDVADDDVQWRGDLDPAQSQAFENWVMNRCLDETAKRGWVHQCHVGAANPATSNPTPLRGLARRYPNMKLVLLHCWPFFAESAELARHVPNVYLDPCWLTVLNPESLRDGLREWLGAVPLHKLTCGHDATSVEMAVGSAVMARAIIFKTLQEHAEIYGLTKSDVLLITCDILHNNAVRLYGVGKTICP